MKLSRYPVARDRESLAWTPEHFHTVAQLAIDTLNISCIILDAVPLEYLQHQKWSDLSLI